MKESLSTKHQKIFDFLIRYYQKDSNFLFTLRQTNRKGRLDRGYWFLGDDNYIAISFWRGRDWITKIPKISFIVGDFGHTRLELSSKDTASKGDFFSKKLTSKLKTQPYRYSNGYWKAYTDFNPEDYLKSLEMFLMTDKELIDRAIINEECFWPGFLQYTDPVEFISKGDFNAQLKNIYEYQKLQKDSRQSSGYLKSISIRNFGPINNLEINDIPDSCRWIFLTGEMDRGKHLF